MFTIKAVRFWEKLFTPNKHAKKTAKSEPTPRYFIIPGLVADPFYFTHTRVYIHTSLIDRRERDRETERLPLLLLLLLLLP